MSPSSIPYLPIDAPDTDGAPKSGGDCSKPPDCTGLTNDRFDVLSICSKTGLVLVIPLTFELQLSNVSKGLLGGPAVKAAFLPPLTFW